MRTRLLLSLSLVLGCDGTAPADKSGDSIPATDAVDLDEDGFFEAEDCDDADPDVNPDAEETCDGADQDCDGEIDEDAADALSWYADADADGFGDSATGVTACDAPAGATAAGGDCDDTDPAYYPGAAESCTDLVDYDCDGALSSADADGDGFVGCAECDDTDPEVNPDAVERCDTLDNDCDGEIDEADAADAATWYADADEDRYGDLATVVLACMAPAGFIADASDCDDADRWVSPGAPEYCNRVDDDCDGEIDEADAEDAGTWYADTDGDSYGDSDTGVLACDGPVGFVPNADDCDDDDLYVSPASSEVCNGIDDNCDGDTVEIGYLPGWSSTYTSSSLVWSTLQSDALRYGDCPITVTDVPASYTTAVLSAYDVIILSDPSGTALRYSAVELSAIRGYLDGGYGGAIATYLLKWSSDNSDVADLFGVPASSLTNTSPAVSTTGTVINPSHPITVGLPSTFSIISYPQEQGTTSGWASVPLLAGAERIIGGSGQSSVIVNEGAAWRAVWFTGMVDYSSAGEDSRQSLYNAVMWAAGYQ